MTTTITRLIGSTRHLTCFAPRQSGRIAGGSGRGHLTSSGIEQRTRTPYYLSKSAETTATSGSSWSTTRRQRVNPRGPPVDFSPPVYVPLELGLGDGRTVQSLSEMPTRDYKVFRIEMWTVFRSYIDSISYPSSHYHPKMIGSLTPTSIHPRSIDSTTASIGMDSGISSPSDTPLSKAITVASLILAAPTLTSPSSSITAQRRRIHRYTDLIYCFASINHIEACMALLRMQRDEGLEASVEAVSASIQAGLRASGGSGWNGGSAVKGTGKGKGENRRRGKGEGEGTEILRELMPFLPEKGDARLLTQLIRVLVKEVGVKPEEVRVMIDGCVERFQEKGVDSSERERERTSEEAGPQEEEAVQAGARRDGRRGSISNSSSTCDMRDWDRGLVDAYLASFAARGEWRGAVEVLMEFKSIVEMQSEGRRSAQGEATLSSSESDVSEQSTSASFPQTSHVLMWTNEECQAITRPFITTLSLFTEKTLSSSTHREGRKMSRIPETIIRQYLELVPLDTYGMGTVEIWNAWMNAERVVGNLDAASAVWGMISGLDVTGEEVDLGVLADELDLDVPVGETPEMDGITWTTLFKLLKNLSIPPSPAIMERFIAERDRDLDRSEGIVCTTTINAALSVVLGTTHPVIESSTNKRPIAPPSTTASGDAEAEDEANARAQHRQSLCMTWMLLDQFSHLQSPTSPQHGGRGRHQMPEREQRPNERTIDIVGAGLIKLWRAGLGLWDAGERWRIPRLPDRSIPIWSRSRTDLEAEAETLTDTDKTWTGNVRGTGSQRRDGISSIRQRPPPPTPMWVSHHEWAMINDTLHLMQMQRKVRAPSAGQNDNVQRQGKDHPTAHSSSHGIEGLDERYVAELPLSRPTARLDRFVSSPTILPPLPGSETQANFMGSLNPLQDLTSGVSSRIDNNITTIITRSSPDRALDRAEEMLDPMLKLVEQGLAVLVRQSVERREEEDRESERGMGLSDHSPTTSSPPIASLDESRSRVKKRGSLVLRDQMRSMKGTMRRGRVP